MLVLSAAGNEEPNQSKESEFTCFDHTFAPAAFELMQNPSNCHPLSPFADLLDQWKAAGLIDPSAPKPAPRDPASFVREQRLARFKELCPVEFQQKIDRSKLPNLAAWDEADAWTGCAPGLWLWSHETGRGKT